MDSCGTPETTTCRLYFILSWTHSERFVRYFLKKSDYPIIEIQRVQLVTHKTDCWFCQGFWNNLMTSVLYNCFFYHGLWLYCLLQLAMLWFYCAFFRNQTAKKNLNDLLFLGMDNIKTVFQHLEKIFCFGQILRMWKYKNKSTIIRIV